jgi:hypothetical protein
MARIVWEAVRLNAWIALVSSCKELEEVVDAVDEVTTYLLLKVRRVLPGEPASAISRANPPFSYEAAHEALGVVSAVVACNSAS